MKGKIVLIPFPFTDLTSAKLRPALVLVEGDKDCVVAFPIEFILIGLLGGIVAVTLIRRRRRL